jgi:hypothetical protein
VIREELSYCLCTCVLIGPNNLNTYALTLIPPLELARHRLTSHSHLINSSCQVGTLLKQLRITTDAANGRRTDYAYFVVERVP